MESNPRIEVWNEEKETLLTQYRKKPFITDIINLKNRRNDLSPGYWILIMLNLGYPTEELKGGEEGRKRRNFIFNKYQTGEGNDLKLNAR